MAQAILVGLHHDLKKHLGPNLSAYLGLDVLEKNSPQDALTFLDLLGDEVELIVTQEKSGTEMTADKLIRGVEQRDLLLPVLVVGDEEKSTELIHFLKGPSWKDIVLKAGESLGVSREQMAKQVIPRFCAFPLSFLHFVDQTNCDLYLRLRPQGDGQRLAKVWGEQDYIDFEDVKNLEDKGQRHFLVSEEHRNIFLNFLSSRLSEMQEDDETSLDRRVALAAHAHALITFLCRAEGLTSSSIQLAQAVTDSLVYSVNQISGFKALLPVFQKLGADPVFQLFHLTSVFGYDIIRRLEWGTQDHHNRLTFGAFFCDVFLPAPKAALIRTKSEWEGHELSETQQLPSKEQILGHAAKAAELLERVPGTPAGVESLVRFHHGDLHGQDLKDVVEKPLAPLVNILLVASETAALVLQTENLAAKTVKGHLQQRFPHPAFAPLQENILASWED